MEEYFTMSTLASVLDLNASEFVENWAPASVVKGFTRKFLKDHALRCFKEEKWEFCNAVLALLVHGIVLFPNIDNFIDQMAVEIFLVGNLVAFMLADLYRTFHTRNEKKGGTFLFYAPILHIWMRIHIPQKDHIVSSNLT